MLCYKKPLRILYQFSERVFVMLCPKCKSELLEGSATCEKCGAVLNKKWYQKNSPLTIAIMIIAFCFLGFAIWFFVSSGNNTRTKSTVGKITLSQYNQIENGMTYEEVKQIIGSDGELFSEVGEKGTEYYTAIYVWDGTEIGSSASFSFQNNKLEIKTQIGLS